MLLLFKREALRLGSIQAEISQVCRGGEGGGGGGRGSTHANSGRKFENLSLSRSENLNDKRQN